MERLAHPHHEETTVDGDERTVPVREHGEPE